jgi:hypothetical protein
MTIRNPITYEGAVNYPALAISGGNKLLAVWTTDAHRAEEGERQLDRGMVGSFVRQMVRFTHPACCRYRRIICENAASSRCRYAR